MPTGPVRTVHDMPISTRAHPAEQWHRTHTEPRNYYFEHPNRPIISKQEVDEEPWSEERDEARDEGSHHEQADSVEFNLFEANDKGTTHHEEASDSVVQEL